jgi:glycosyltransferase involved in cell wall biosynthesis
MPVYNGENFLKEGLDSILAQTFKDFEVIISDNASSDKTGEICQIFAAQDSRIRYYRNEKNIGAAKNFNRVFELACGEYFKWAAHDDVCAPENIERCVEVLNSDSSVVLCYPKTIIIDEVNKKTIKYDDGFHFVSPKPHERYRSYHERVRGGHGCNPIFGLIRADVLGQTALMGAYPNSDHVLLGELVLHGKVYEVPEFLFFKRNHPQTSMLAYPSHKSRVAWFDPDKRGKCQLVRWRMFLEYVHAINRIQINREEKTLCYLQAGKWFMWYLRWLGKDLIKACVWPFLPVTLKD